MTRLHLLCIVSIATLTSATVFMLVDTSRVTIDPNLVPYPYTHDVDDFLLPLWPEDANATRGFDLPAGQDFTRPLALAVHPWSDVKIVSIECIYGEHPNGVPMASNQLPTVVHDPNNLTWSTTIHVLKGPAWVAYRVVDTRGKAVDYRITYNGVENPGATIR